jgi:flagellar basal-body rod protein FlgB
VDIKMLDELQKRMDGAVAKAAVATGNLANLETPGYRTREATFSDVLEGRLGSAPPLTATHTEHLQASGQLPEATREVAGLAPRLDGNNVQLDRELLKLSGASGEFKRAAAAYDAIAKQLRYAITEGK